MSQKSRTARRLAVAGSAALVALGAATAPAQAASLKLDYQCKYPLIGVQPLTIDIDSTLPSNWVSGASPQFAISAVATAGGSTGGAIKALGAQTLEGTASAFATYTVPGAAPLPLDIPIDIAKWTRPSSVPSPLVLAAYGKTPALSLTKVGTATATVDELSLNLRARDRNGASLELAPVTTDLDGKAITPADSDPGTFDVPCKVKPGQNTTLASINVTAGPAPSDTSAPTKPGGVKGTAATSLIDLSWNASTDNVGVASYDIYDGSTKLTSVAGTKALLGGLNPNTTYSLKVVAVDRAGNQTSSDTVSIRTAAAGDGGPGGNTITYGYNITGNASLRTLTSGSVPVNGGIDANFDLLSGDFSGELILNKTKARLNLLSFIPVTADVAFAQNGLTTGVLKDGVLKATAKLRIKLPQLYLFGAVPIAGPGTCQAAQVSTIPLTSTDAFFDPIAGGNLRGTFSLSNLQGCGFLNDIISPFAAGSGNQINIKLNPKG